MMTPEYKFAIERISPVMPGYLFAMFIRVYKDCVPVWEAALDFGNCDAHEAVLESIELANEVIKDRQWWGR